MKANKVGYITGYVVGIMLVYGVYALALFGMFDQIRNGQVPYVPIILFIAMSIWRRTTQAYTLLIALSLALTQRPASKDISNDQLAKLMQQVIKHGGPN